MYILCIRARDVQPSVRDVIETKCERLVFPAAAKRQSHVCKIELKNRTSDVHQLTIQRPEAPFFLQHTRLTIKSVQQPSRSQCSFVHSKSIFNLAGKCRLIDSYFVV